MAEQYWDGENWLTVFSNSFGTYYYFNGVFHRNNGPSVIYYCEYSSTKFYYFNGKLHKKDEPAIIKYYNNSSIVFKEYFFKGIEFNPKKLPFDLPIDTKEKEFLFKLKYGG